MRTYSENNDVFPSVRQWLKVNGYTWREQVVLGDRRADIVAKHIETGETFIIEVKARYYSAPQVVRQVQEYGALYSDPAVKLAIAVSDRELNKNLPTLCLEHGIRLIAVSVRYEDRPTYPAAVIKQPAPAQTPTPLPARVGLLTDDERLELLNRLRETQPEQYRKFAALVNFMFNRNQLEKEVTQ